ncbi:MAG: FecR domain-containing protein [Myxococcales bacterium]|nr:FecR domain-containing protein [Myxococcales bacterium]
MTDEHARHLAQTPVPWDDLRQQRVLARIEAALPIRARARRRRRIAAAVAGTVAAAAAVLLVLAPASSPREEPLVMPAAGSSPDAVAVAPTPSIPFVTWPELRLPDDSRAQLRHGARVDVEIESDALVRLSQHDGEVRYEVTPDRTRSFVVDAAGIEVRVVGTIFTVTVDEEASRVGVQVERGLVEVDNGARVAELGPGDSLGLDIEDELVLVDPDPLPSRPAARPTAPSIETLLADADAARARGDLSRAASALGELVRRHPKDPRAYSAHFQLGKVERARGRHAAAAAAFVRCWKHSPRGALAEDARAESAVSWKAAGRADRARTAAEEYLRHHPSGTHRARMQALLAELP